MVEIDDLKNSKDTETLNLIYKHPFKTLSNFDNEKPKVKKKNLKPFIIQTSPLTTERLKRTANLNETSLPKINITNIGSDYFDNNFGLRNTMRDFKINHGQY